MKRLKNFILGLLIVAIVGFLLFMYIKDSRISQYQHYFLQFNWFQPLLIGLAALLILIGLILVLSIFKPTYRKPGLYKDYNDGHIYVSRKAVEKTAYDTLAKYEDVRQPNVVSKLYNKKNNSYIDIKADFFVPNNVQVKSLTESIRADIKDKVEYFTEMPVRKLEINVRDQKSAGQRVI
ncbi:alkaline shock response membrane anchor protein AmaP [Staphylococcus sp. NRL 16/872]|uniref:alkaline shock response membrane anchor protein AmaP n=1 Tax=Staphylococcus sp. NRL 16/872 TaxID=2930131 RepID=UPI001FB2391B|nr:MULTISPECIES: alkaline shock response membrane anchor protein AmaP [unclassified Staphylococcus]MCJ1655845.1 alkaline shock response membrane anchor protein AmaP [Staphylococcus sp. NRL 21/187]MCJ1661653.1 alkaline shock response membrane anchor protein AmaP [Staphylococcus sp. NRL 18/288]MCJ1667580.1 alkaline shock response membrane anchor protein AmaP [Staphylococcus sp. NRL 19/737]WEN70065.1 alkaline shock response membrane anchor protein AmaP [Staphylococcus sp. NRL 16/872]